MKSTFTIPYERYALIAEISRREQGLGRTALQKYIYLLKALYDVEVGYGFSIYTYGPFDSEILADLDAAEATGAVNVARTPAPYFGYKIWPGPAFESISAKAESFLVNNRKAFDDLFSSFGGLNAKELELRATIVFANKDAATQNLSIEELIDTVHEIKPGFTRIQIADAVNDLKKKNYIQV